MPSASPSRTTRSTTSWPWPGASAPTWSWSAPSCRSRSVSPIAFERRGSRSSARARRRRGSRAPRRSRRTSWRATASRRRASRSSRTRPPRGASAGSWARPLVVKADGLAAGKGAIVCRTLDEADGALRLCLEEGAFGAAGRTVVVEEFMEGEEASFFVVTDGTSALPLAGGPGSQDHLRRRPRARIRAAWARTRRRRVMDAATERRVMDEIVAPDDRGHGQGGRALRGRPLRRAHDHARTGRASSSSTAASAIPSARPSCRASTRTSCRSSRPWRGDGDCPRRFAGAPSPPSASCWPLAAIPAAPKVGDADQRPRRRRRRSPASTSSTPARRAATAASSRRAAACSASRRWAPDIALGHRARL